MKEEERKGQEQSFVVNIFQQRSPTSTRGSPAVALHKNFFSAPTPPSFFLRAAARFRIFPNVAFTSHLCDVPKRQSRHRVKILHTQSTATSASDCHKVALAACWRLNNSSCSMVLLHWRVSSMSL